MAKRDLEIRYQGRPSKFAMHPIDRNGLYGFRRRIALDSQGRECATAHLTRDGLFLLPAGSTAHVYVDEKGDTVERSELAGCADRSTGGKGAAIEGPVLVDEFLDHVVRKAYLLHPKLVDPRLLEALRRGEMFRLPRESDSTADTASFLFANAHGAFLVRAVHCGFEFVGLAQIADGRVDSAEDDPTDAVANTDDAFTFDFAIGGG